MQYHTGTRTPHGTGGHVLYIGWRSECGGGERWRVWRGKCGGEEIMSYGRWLSLVERSEFDGKE